MRARVLKNLNGIDAGHSPEVIHFSKYRKIFAAAACFVCLLLGANLFMGRLETKPEPPVQMVPDIENYASSEELSKAIGFDVPELQKLPFEAQSEAYTSLWGEVAQIEYRSGEQAAVFRKSAGSGDKSGDYTVYETETTVVAGVYSVTLKGNGGLYCLALWEGDGYSYSLRMAPGISEEEMVRMIQGLG